MGMFKWEGMNQGQATNGQIDAADEAEARMTLESAGIVITKIISTEPAGGSAGDSNATDQADIDAEEQAKFEKLEKSFKPKNIKTKELIMFTKKLATMVRSGLPIMKTLKMLESQTESPNFKFIITKIYKTVEGGSTLSGAFEVFPSVFDTIYINLLKAGETSGKLTLFLNKLVIQLDKAQKIKARVKGALMYPIILLSVAVAVIGLMMIKVVPIFANMFSSMGNSLPAPTQLIVDISDFLRNPAQGGIIFGCIFAGVIVSKKLISSNYEFRKKFHRLLLKSPLIGEVIRKSILSKVAMIQGNLYAAGVSVLESLDITYKTTTNEIYREAFLVVREGVASGQTLSSLYEKFPDLFPPTFCQMLAVGEETGNMDEMFETTAMFYEEEFDMVVDRMTEMLEPIMIVFMGLTVGFIIVAMYMPIFQMGAMMG
ncbi:type II secretion system F family protein [Rickettsiales bacterium]|nr:type II secretion system F family protein [Rickettsiales bacterium]